MKHISIALFCILSVQSSYAQTWKLVNTGTTINLWCSTFIDSTHGWLAGGSGGKTTNNILRTTDGGASFVTNSTGYYNDISGLSALDMSNAWVADGSIILKQTTDGGATWKLRTPGPSPTFPYNLLHDVFFKDANHGWTVGDNGTIYRTIDGGTSWIKAPTVTAINLKTVFFATVSAGWAGGDFASILKTTDGGASWTVVVTPTAFGRTTYAISDIFFADAGRGWAAVAGAVLRTSDGGNTWIPASTQDADVSVFFNERDGWAVGTFGAISRSGDGGVTWASSIDVGDAFLYSVCFPDPDHGWVTGSGGTLYKYTTTKATSVADAAAGIPALLSLAQNYPNPFNPSTTITFSLPSQSFVSLKVFDVMGRDVATLASEELTAGSHTRQWNADGVPSGVYFYRLQSGVFTESKKLQLIR